MASLSTDDLATATARFAGDSVLTQYPLVIIGGFRRAARFGASRFGYTPRETLAIPGDSAATGGKPLVPYVRIYPASTTYTRVRE